MMSWAPKSMENAAMIDLPEGDAKAISSPLNDTDQEEKSATIPPSSRQITLYWISGHIASWKIRLALEEKRLQGYRSVMLIRPEQVQRDDPFWNENPYGVVPSLRIGTITLNGVLPILLFLHPDEDAMTYERALQTDRFQRLCTDELIVPLFTGDLTDRERREANLCRELTIWNGQIDSSFTLADVMFFPELATAVHFGLSLNAFPRLKLYYEQNVERPSVRRTWPHHWRADSISYDFLSKVDRFVDAFENTAD